MNKIVQAVNAMILGKEKIFPVITSEKGELFFVFDEKYKWSMSRNDVSKDYYLHFYPFSSNITDIAMITDWTKYENKYITYSTKELKAQEAIESFAELFNILMNKRYNMDSILDKIIGDIL
jgi:hypothetical protein